jgi:hypothetical protein
VNRTIALIGGALLGALASGCSGEKYAELSGTVTLKGAPLKSGIVTFFPSTGEPFAATIENGNYTLATARYGEYRVTVTQLAESPEVSSGAGGRKMKPGEVDPTATVGKGDAAPKPAQPVPDKYKSVDTSGLSVTIDQPKTTYLVPLN